MEKLKAKLLTYELPLHIHLKYDCQNGMFIIALFPVGDFIKMCGSYFFSVLFHQLLERLGCVSVSGDQTAGTEK